MHANNSHNPSGTSVGARDFADGTVKFSQIDLAAAPSSGLKAADDAGLDEILSG
jgi:hypothetical protein